MINIIVNSDGLVFEGVKKINTPLNSVILLLEKASDIVMFKSSIDYDTIIQEKWQNITINGEHVTKENIVDKFNEIANTPQGGGTKINAGTNITLQPESDGSITISATGELGGTVAWADVTDKPSTFTPSAHNHPISEVTDLQGKLDAKQNTLVSGTNIKTINGESILGNGDIVIEGGTGDVTQQYVDEQLALKVDKTAYEADKATFALKTEIPSVEGLASKEELQNGLEGKQDKGDYALKSELPDISGLATKAEVDETYAKKTDIPDTSDFATKEELASKADASALAAKQDTLVSGENVKTINGQTILGSGNIEIQGGGSGISDAPSDNKLYGRKNANWSEIIIPSTDNFATKSEIADMLTKTEASEKYQPKGEYLTEVPAEYVTETELNGKGYATTVQLDAKQDTLVSGTNIKTVNGNSLLGSGNIVIEGGSGDVTRQYVDEQLALKADKTSVPTVQSSTLGNENNYVYSVGAINDKKNVLSLISSDENETNLNITYQTWNNDTKVMMKLRNASQTLDGAMSAEDKIKLDSINVDTLATKTEIADMLTKTEASTTYKTIASEWYGTQSQYDGIAEKDPNVTYFITEG